MGSEFAAEGAVLEGGEEGVEFGQRRTVRGLQLFHRRYLAREFALEVEGRELDLNVSKSSL